MLLEEAYEFLEAVDRGAADAMREELGDLLYHVVLHAQIASERGAFDLAAVIGGIAEKLLRRHPHVFGAATAESVAEARLRWEEMKQAEGRAKGRASSLDGVPAELPALLQAHRLQVKAAGIGFDWPDLAGPLEKLAEEVGEFRESIEAGGGAGGGAAERARAEGELGDLLFSIVNVARHLGLSPEDALRRTNARFRARFAHVEASARATGRPLSAFTLEELDAFWEEAKAAEAAVSPDKGFDEHPVVR
jgi:tetrapyrrole methylase family protein/MazG family protein